MNKKIFFAILISSIIFLFSNVIAVDTANCTMSISTQIVGEGENSTIDVECSSNVEVIIEVTTDYGGICPLASTGTACVGGYGNYNCGISPLIVSPQNLVNSTVCSDDEALTPRSVCFHSRIKNASNGSIIRDDIGGDCGYGSGSDMYVYEQPRIVDAQPAVGKQTGIQVQFGVDAAEFEGFASGDAIQIDVDCIRNGNNCNYSQFEPEVLIDGFALPDDFELSNYIVPYTYPSGGQYYVALKVVDLEGNARFAQLDGGIFVQETGLDCAAGNTCTTSQSCPGICGVDNFTCNDVPNDNCPVPPTLCEDNDNDGYQAPYCGGNDCDDSRDYINPGQEEVCGDSFDNNCDGIANENCEQIITCEDPCTVNEGGIEKPGSCQLVDGALQCVKVNWVLPPVTPPVDGTSCTAIDNGFFVPGTYQSGICTPNEINPPLLDECSFAQLGEYQCIGSALMQCQNSSAFNFSHAYISPLTEDFKWKLTENCETQCIDSGANDYCLQDFSLISSCIDSTTYAFNDGITSCKDRFGDYSPSCSLVKGNAVVDYRCNTSADLCEPVEVACSSGEICNESQGLVSGTASCQIVQCNAGITGPNMELVCGARFSGAQVIDVHFNNQIFPAICSNLALNKLADWVYNSKSLTNQIQSSEFDDSMSKLFKELKKVKDRAESLSLPISNCGATNFSFDDFINYKADGVCVDWGGTMLVLARSMGVPSDRLDVSGFKMLRPVRIYSPMTNHAVLFYQSGSGEWWVYDFTSACAGQYKSLSMWHAICGAIDTDCSLCRQKTSNDNRYADFTATDAGGACSNILQCENNHCANGTMVGQCIQDAPPYKCGLTQSPLADVSQCGCPSGAGVRTDPYNLGCICSTPLQQIGNTQAFCTDELYDQGLVNGQQYYNISYDCAGADHGASTLTDNINCGTGFVCVPANNGSYPYGKCIASSLII